MGSDWLFFGVFGGDFLGVEQVFVLDLGEVAFHGIFMPIEQKCLHDFKVIIIRAIETKQTLLDDPVSVFGIEGINDILDRGFWAVFKDIIVQTTVAWQ